MSVLSGNPADVTPDQFLDRLNEVNKELAAQRRKIAVEQKGIPTFFDNLLLETVRALFERRKTEDDPRLLALASELYLHLKSTQSPRFMEYATRCSASDGRSRMSWELNQHQMLSTQGVKDCLRWRGQPLFKTVFDCVLYPELLWNLKPCTIIELGAGVGTSPLWLSDLACALGLEVSIFSVDKVKPTVRRKNVTCIEGDCRQIAQALPPATLQALRHPWLVLEDVHVNVGGVLAYLNQFMIKGDYLVVEDSDIKRPELTEFTANQGRSFRVDTYYTDLFGWNATSSADSFFIKT